jgi:hypothetical protein
VTSTARVKKYNNSRWSTVCVLSSCWICSLSQKRIKYNLWAPVFALETFQHSAAVAIRSAIVEKKMDIPLTSCRHDCQTYLKLIWSCSQTLISGDVTWLIRLRFKMMLTATKNMVKYQDRKEGQLTYRSQMLQRSNVSSGTWEAGGLAKSAKRAAYLEAVSDISRNNYGAYDDCWNIPRPFIHCNDINGPEARETLRHSHR